MFDIVNNILNSLDYILDTRKKRHMVGGMLLSTSMLLGGLALTIMTIKNEENTDE